LDDLAKGVAAVAVHSAVVVRIGIIVVWRMVFACPKLRVFGGMQMLQIRSFELFLWKNSATLPVRSQPDFASSMYWLYFCLCPDVFKPWA